MENDEPKPSSPPTREPAAPSPARAPRGFLYGPAARPLAGYTIIEGVGQGGFGEIYRARSDAGKDVALKLIRRNLDVELRGIRHCLNLKHPNLLCLFDIRQDDRGDTWVVMEYIGDQNLEQVLDAHPSGLQPWQALAWIHGIAAGVAYLHERDIVHRDLKPGNIFCDGGVVKVGDYGLSKFISCSRRSGHTESIGTVHYMAPEVARGRYGKELDVYALGVILYELLTGRVPFDGESVGEILMKHITAQPDVSMLAEPYRSVVTKALEKDPEKRYRSAGEMAAALPALKTAAPFRWHPPSELAVEAKAAERGPSEQTNSRGQTAPGGSPDNIAGANGAPTGGRCPPTIALGDAAGGIYPKTIDADDDPVLRAVRTNWQKLRRAWDDANLNTPLKILILVGGLFLAVSNAGILLPLAVVLCAAYGAYRIVRAFAKDGKQIAADSRGQTAPGESNSRGQTAPGGSPENIAGANGAPTGGRCPPAIVLGDAVGGSDPKAMDGIDTTPLPGRAVAEPKHRACRSWLEKPLPALVVKPPRERLAELLGSMLLSALVAAVACVVVVLVESYCAGSLGAPREEQIAWLLLTSIAGAWAVLIPSKSWEGTRGEPIVRRLTMMVVGMLLGLASFAAAQLFLVDLPPAAGYPQSTDYALPPQFYAAGGKPLAMAYMAAFGTLFLVMRWWRQADPLRRTRLSLWTLFVVAIVSGAAAYAWQFPQPWLPMAAVTISAAVQLSSPWTHPKRRRH